MVPDPSYHQLNALPIRLRRTIDASMADVNGHLNVQHHFALGQAAVVDLFERHGFGEAYPAERRLGVFAVEHHLRYRREVAGDTEITVRERLLAQTDRSFHVIFLLVDEARQHLASTFEAAFVHVDLHTRRAVPFPPGVGLGIAADVRAQEDLRWPAPVGSAIGLRSVTGET